ncbi:Response regulator receiver protein [uncultured Desulfobacterium sp.]|uniref:Response regulator receiver protein n=1 Tax=uncultured Desulfobacterium sp. TaxID=201089 RepID=A0A445MY54_9BACT|nr:Response regulator receiver protein [uncultured Desulfobacterium sp.]
MTEKENLTPSTRIKLLLVDDEEGFVNVIANRMSKRGIDATKALSGSDALKAIRKQDFDLAVVDLKMQEMDGIELLRILKKMIPEMPVIVLTGHGSERAAEDGMEYGAYDYLTKPCEMDELMEKIHEALARGR